MQGFILMYSNVCCGVFFFSVNSGKGTAYAELTEIFIFPSPHFRGWGLKDISWWRQVENQLM